MTAQLDRRVFFIAAGLLVIVLALTALLPGQAESLFRSLQATITAEASWYYVMVVAIILVSVVVLAVTSFGDIKLGPDHAEPDYSFTSWFAMMFAAGMGIGLMFFGVSEPVMHFLDPPQGDGATVAAAREAMKLTYFHWGLHAWAIYAVVAVILAYFAFRHDLPLTLRSALYPLIGERMHGGWGVAVDVFAILSTTFGVATSLGFGVEQINSGLAYLFDVPKATWVQVLLIVITTALATVSVVLGLDTGIKRLSEINIVLAILLMLLVLLLGPTVLLLQSFMQNTGAYLSDIVAKTFNLYAYEPNDWLGGWTIFYWGWWISWAPFVGLFIARISRGRTLRQFVIGALLAPTLFTLFWMTVFGNSAIELILHGGQAALGEAVRADASVALFQFLHGFPASGLLSMLAVLMVMVFFVTSADSGAMVLNMLSAGGSENTPIWLRIFWMGAIGLTALIMMLAGGLSALQTAAIAGALPFSIALLVALWGFVKALRVDRARRLVLTAAPTTAATSGEHWQARLAKLLNYPTQSEVGAFLTDVAAPVLREFARELGKHGVSADVDALPGRVTLRATHHSIDFLYELVDRPHSRPAVANAEPATYHRAEVHLTEGGQDYDVMGWSREQLADDIATQYERHLNFLHVLR
ncbi:MAG: BCCT family transporter [Pseudomonadales bacterium]